MSDLKNQSLDLNHLNGVQALDDEAAQVLTGGVDIELFSRNPGGSLTETRSRSTSRNSGTERIPASADVIVFDGFPSRNFDVTFFDGAGRRVNQINAEPGETINIPSNLESGGGFATFAGRTPSFGQTQFDAGALSGLA